MTAPAVLCEPRDGVLLITLNRPERRNAVDQALADGLAAALDRLERSDGLAAGVIHGAGATFSAGMDLKEFARTGKRPHVTGRGFAGIVERIPAKPVIAAVEGYAVAGGLEIALACDIIVASRESRLGLPEVTRGLVAVGGALLRLPDRLGRSGALLLALTGDVIPAERAAGMGLVDVLAEPGEACRDALALAARIARNAPLAVTATRSIVRQQDGWSADDAWQRQRQLAGPVFGSQDAREGALAFAEKRSPRWRGR